MRAARGGDEDDFLAWAEAQGRLARIERPVDPHLEMARLIHARQEQPLLFADPRRPGWQVAAGVCARREHFAWALDTGTAGIVPRLIEALRQPASPATVAQAPCQEVVDRTPHLDRLPILKHLPGDGGPYITAAVAIIRDPDYGRNACFHRLMQTGPHSLTARIVEGRGTDTAWRKAVAAGRDLDIAICLGSRPVLLAAAMSRQGNGYIANALAPSLARCLTVDLRPAECGGPWKGTPLSSPLKDRSST